MEKKTYESAFKTLDYPMKLKEIPLSAYHSFRLKMLSVEKLTTPKSNAIPVIVSLTSIPSRLSKLHITLRSILDQSRPPKKIVLWLNENHQSLIPKSLRELESEVFEIRFTPLTCSHKKLVHSLVLFPTEHIVTSDDDFIYDKKWLESLYEAHQKNPNSIIAHQVRQITYDSDKNLLDYKNWKYKNPENSKVNLAIGAGGVWYPPQSLHPTVIDTELFLKLAPKADDLWFKAMSLLQNTEVLPSGNPPKHLIPVFGTQKVSLKKDNVDGNLNVSQWNNLATYFNLEISE